MTENDWVKAVNDSAPLLLPNYYMAKPRNKPDLCRLAELYLRGGYYMDVDQVATLPYQPPRDTIQLVDINQPCTWVSQYNSWATTEVLSY